MKKLFILLFMCLGLGVFGQGVKISELPSLTSGFTSDAFVPVSKSGVTYKASLDAFLTKNSISPGNYKFTGIDTFVGNTTFGNMYINGSLGNYPYWGWNNHGTNGYLASGAIGWDGSGRLTANYFYGSYGLYAPSDTTNTIWNTSYGPLNGFAFHNGVPYYETGGHYYSLIANVSGFATKEKVAADSLWLTDILAIKLSHEDTMAMLSNYQAALNARLTIAAAASTYQPIGSYLTASSITGKLNYTDTPAMLSSYQAALNARLTIAAAASTYQPIGSYLTASSITGKLNYTDTPAMLSAYQAALNARLTIAAAVATYQPIGSYLTSSSITGKLNYTDTPAMLSAYQAALNARLTIAVAAATYQPIGSYLTSINSSMVTTALGFTPYNSTNPNGFITSSSLSTYATISKVYNDSLALIAHADADTVNVRPRLVAGTNMTITGTYPNLTLAAAGSSGGLTGNGTVYDSKLPVALWCYNNSKLTYPSRGSNVADFISFDTITKNIFLAVANTSSNVYFQRATNGFYSGAFHCQSDGSGAFYAYDGTSSYNIAGYFSTDVRLTNTGIYGWGSNVNSPTTSISRLANATIGVGNGTQGNTSGTIIVAQYKLSSLNTAPASSSDTGVTGDIRFTAGNLFLCTATNTWVRVAFSTF